MADSTPTPTEAPIKPVVPKRKRIKPALYNILGIMLLVGVILMTLPLSIPRLFGYEVYNVVSGSMEPEIPQDSVVYVEYADPSDVEEGEVIAFQRNDAVVAHRAIINRTSVGEFVTKGDANNAEDPDPVPYDNFLGTVAYHVPLVGNFMSLYMSNVGRIYLLIAAACGVMLNILAARLRQDRKIEAAIAAIEAARSGAGAATGDDAEGTDTAASADEPVAVPNPPKRRRILSVLRALLVVVLLSIFLGSFGVVTFVTHQRSESDRIYKEASDQFAVEDTEAGTDDGTIPPIKIDFKNLCGKNEDVVGWIYCKGTPINYPVLHGQNNDEYLRHDYTREYNIDGSIFVDSNNTKGFVDANTIVYGHHMNHGAMFATLDKWAEQSYYEKHPIMWLLTPTQDYQVVLVSGHHVSAYSNMYDILHNHDDAFARFLNEATEMSDFTPIEDATVNPDRNYIMLSTCAYIFDNARYVLHGKLVPVDSAGGVPFSQQ